MDTLHHGLDRTHELPDFELIMTLSDATISELELDASRMNHHVIVGSITSSLNSLGERCPAIGPRRNRNHFPF